MTRVTQKGFRVQTIIRQRLESRKRRSAQRLDRFNFPDDLSQPMLRGSSGNFVARYSRFGPIA